MKKTTIMTTLCVIASLTGKAQINAFGNTFSSPSTATNGNSILGSANSLNQNNTYGCMLSGWSNVLSGSNAHQVHILGNLNSITASNVTNSFIFGSNSTLSQSGSSSIGNYNSLTGASSFAIGNYCMTGAQGAMSFGTFCNANATNAFVLGTGLSNNFLTNTTANSLLVSFENSSASTRPTFFVTAPNTANASTFDNYGTVGIGTNDTKGHTLGVRGDIIAEKMQVALYSLPWPDYVFSEDYTLTPLERVEKYIQENNRLPELPSAESVQANGYDLADMDAVLLKKIEELTLYVIDLKKENDKMKMMLSTLTSKK